ncbi:glycosyltransferase [Paracoccus sp. MBLB3053]|uniref:Glycosyltransferase n=1 Tax=Paracoccus aurantius TaxID=3073814 RepID=A0ABU2HYB4_9RHOB|nr:glycosyltransferase [Paracoccus sp. MBLB3053]MDS9470053.1 glycosyltransferase [Paracoccus sp. MBLB3053]
MKSSGPLVSVVVPAFNAEATLARTLASVLRQSHQTLELLVVDDGSTDRTAQIAADLAQADPRLRVIRKENGGVASARNAALAEARGNYIAWLDADDLWHPDKLARQLACLAASGELPAFVYSGYRMIDADDVIIPAHRPLSDLSGDTLCLQMATNFFSNVSSVLTRTSFVRALGGHDIRLRGWGVEGAEDLLMQLRLMRFGPALCCREALVGYRMHQANMSRAYSRAAASNLRVLRMVAREYPAVPAWVRDLACARVVGFVPLIALAGSPIAALRLFLELMQGQPAATAAMGLRVLMHGLRHGRGAGGAVDPALGQDFASADPRTAIWAAPILLSPSHERRLRDADQQVGRALRRHVLSDVSVPKGIERRRHP